MNTLLTKLICFFKGHDVPDYQLSAIHVGANADWGKVEKEIYCTRCNKKYIHSTKYKVKSKGRIFEVDEPILIEG